MREFVLGSVDNHGYRVDCVKTTVPTYNGKWTHTRAGVPDFVDLQTPVLICHAEGLRIVLGTHDYHDCDKPEILIERRHNGWMFFLVPPGLADVGGYVVFLDDGRSYVVAEAGVGSHQIKMVELEIAVAELDNRAAEDAVLPTMIVQSERAATRPRITAKVAISPHVIDAFKSAQEAVASDSNDAEHNALLALVEALDACNVVEWRTYAREWLIEDFRDWAKLGRGECPDCQDIDTYVREARPADSSPLAVKEILYDWAENRSDFN